MNQKMPRTPFSTPLSGSARETELRLKNIFSGPKKQPPALFLALVFAMCVLCGNLVSCHTAEADTPDSSLPENPPEEWMPVELDHQIVCFSGFGTIYGPAACPICRGPLDDHDQQCDDLLSSLPADELPREAADCYYAMPQDYWNGMLLPVAFDEASDVTLYFVFDPDSIPELEPPQAYFTIHELKGLGTVLRYGDKAQFSDISWETQQKYARNPWLAVDDFDGDGQPEAATSLGWGSGTGAYCECLYMFDLDSPLFAAEPALLDPSEIPLDISVSPDGKTARLVSGEQELEVDIAELGDRFHGQMEVGNIIQFYWKDGHILCELDVDFTCDTLGYMARAFFPVIYQDGAYRLGPAELLTDDLYTDDLQELYERSRL